MHQSLGVLALILLDRALVLAQNCPTGYNRTINWSKCPTEDEPRLECAILQVPLDYNDVSSSSIPMPLVRVPATTPSQNGSQSVIYNPGGPGGSGIGQFAAGGGSSLQEEFGEQYNFLTFDPRGVALSAIFEGGLDNYACPTDEDVKTGPYETDALLNYAISNFTLQAKTCAMNPWGTDGQYIGSPANARDIVAVFQALAGEDGYVRYYGASYGTLLGSTLASMFPEKMERVVLDGNINPTDYYYGDGSEATADIDAAVAQFFHECAGAPDLCVLADKNQTGTQLLQEYNDFLSELKKESDTMGNWNSYYSVKSSWVGDLKLPSGFADVAQKLYNYYRSDEDLRIKRQAPFDAADAAVAEKYQEENGMVLYGVTCADYEGPRVATLDSFRKLRDAYNKRSFYSGDSSLLNIIYQCSTWQTKNKDQFNASLTNVKTRNPILFVNGEFDPVTPLVSAQNSSAGFVGSGVLRHNGGGVSQSQFFAHLVANVSNSIVAVWSPFNRC